MKDDTSRNWTRRTVLQAAPLAVGVVMGQAVAGQPVTQDPAGSTVAVAMDGSEQFGPQTPGTRTSGIQEAIEAVHAAGGGIVHLRKAVYPIVNVMSPPEDANRFGCGALALRLYDDITLRGESMDHTVLRIAAECNINTILGWQTSRVCLEELTLDGGGLNRGYGLAIFGMGTSFADVLLRRVKSVNVGTSAIGVAGGERVTIEQCVAAGAKTGFEFGAPSKDYWVLHCTARNCSNSTLIFNPADHYNEMGNLHPHVIGGMYDGEGKAAGVVLWDCYEPIISGVTATRGVTTNLQIATSNRSTITTPVGGGIIESCVALGSVGSPAGRYGIGACQDGVRVTGCSVVANEDVGIVARPGDGGQVIVAHCVFRTGEQGRQKYGIVPGDRNVRLLATGNAYDGPSKTFLGNAGALAVPGSLFSDNAGYNPVGLLPGAHVPASGEFVANTHPCRVEAHVYGGAVMQVRKRDVTGTAATVAVGSNVAVRLEPGEAVAIEYAERPEWTWFGD